MSKPNGVDAVAWIEREDAYAEGYLDGWHDAAELDVDEPIPYVVTDAGARVLERKGG